MTDAIRFGSRRIGPTAPPFVIAELSGNHNGSLERALAIVDAAADAGAHAVKLQTYTPETMTLDIADGDFLIDDPSSLWDGRTLYELYAEASTPWEWHDALFARARARGMECFSTPFDETAVAYLERLDPPGYKIASFELTDLRLIAKVAQTGRPMIVSTGMASISEIEDAVHTARDNGCQDLILLKCTSTYPATPENSNIATIPHMRDAFGVQVGLSDHTAGVGVAVASVALGAVAIEKHFTLRRADGGVDSAFSIEPHELQALVLETNRAWQGVGAVRYGTSRAEETSKRFRRSIYVSADIRAGEELTTDNVRIVRPGYGIAPKHYESVLGRKARVDLKRGMRLGWDALA